LTIRDQPRRPYARRSDASIRRCSSSPARCFRCGRRPPAQPAIFYPARGIAAVWEPVAAAAPSGLTRVLGATRARLLVALERPAATIELAERLQRSAPAISQHLGALRAAGLVASQRDGRQVIYALTDVGERLVRDGHA
jgi:DNA-binding transcriptional ArsR family regulator